jgi:hypothetical protein
VFRHGLPASSRVQDWHATTPRPSSTRAYSAYLMPKSVDRLQTFTMHMPWTHLRISWVRQMLMVSSAVHMLTHEHSHVPTHQTHLEPANGSPKEDWLRSTIRFRSRLHPVLNHPHRASRSRWEAAVARSKVANHVDYYRVLDR